VTKSNTSMWDAMGDKFPPVGHVVNFWVDELSKYKKGFVVYSGSKGATVDIGYLVSSGEDGDFAEYTTDMQERDDEIEWMCRRIGVHSNNEVVRQCYDAGWRKNNQ
jgi:hypothetical protein